MKKEDKSWTASVAAVLAALMPTFDEFLCCFPQVQAWREAVWLSG